MEVTVAPTGNPDNQVLTVAVVKEVVTAASLLPVLANFGPAKAEAAAGVPMVGQAGIPAGL
jgi:hypothetical protein